MATVTKQTKPVKPTLKRPVIAKETAIGARRELAKSDSTDAYQERRREIAGAAARVFHKKGYQGTTIGAVAKELGTDRASLYYYISSKEDLYDEVVREVSEANVATAERIKASSESAPEKIRVLIESLMASYAEHFPILYVYIRENLAQVAGDRTAWSKHMRKLNKRYEDAIVAIVKEGIEAGTIRPVASARVIAYGVIGMVGWTNRWFDPTRSADSAHEISGGFADMVLSGIATT
jgi:TetR/AcrR family transcriptional regulator, cholesterol catabolism regulator